MQEVRAGTSLRRPRPVTLPALLALAALAAISATPAPAGAAVSYPQTQSISAADAYADDTLMVVDEQGRATLVWEHFQFGYSILARRIGADDTPQTSHPLHAPGGTSSFNPDAAIDSQGRVTVVWEQGDGVDLLVRAVRLGVDGTPGTVHTLSAPGAWASSPHVAVDPQGVATVVWTREVAGTVRVQARTIDADGVLGTTQEVSPATAHAQRPRVDVDSGGRATIAWLSGNLDETRVQAVRRSAGGELGEVKTLSSTGHASDYPHVVVEPAGRATVSWSRKVDHETTLIEATRLAASDGSQGPVHEITSTGGAHQSGLELDAGGRAVFLWYRWDGSNTRVEARRLRSDGTLEPVLSLSPAGEDAASSTLAIGSQDRPTFLWVSWGSDPLSAADDELHAMRLRPNGTPGPVKPIEGHGAGGSSPVAGADPQGRVRFAWVTGVSGGYYQLETVRSELGFPETTITGAPAAPGPNPTFSFTSSASGSTFECRLSGGSFSPCASPKSYGGLAHGTYGFEVRAVDPEDDVDPTPASRTFTVAAGPPPPPPPEPDTVVEAVASAKKTQRQKGKRVVVKVKVAAREAVAARAGGAVKLGKKAFKLKAATAQVPADKSAVLAVSPKKAAHSRAILKALKRGKKASAKLTVRLTDQAKNTKTMKLAVKLKR